MKKSLIVLAALVMVGSAHATDWQTLSRGVIGVQSNDKKASLELTTVSNEENPNDTGLAFYYYPPAQPVKCDVNKDIYKQFAVNGKVINFKKFCFNEDKRTVAYTPMTASDASALVSQLVSKDTDNKIILDSETFSTAQFAEQVDILLAD